jgi:hypothetical protein
MSNALLAALALLSFGAGWWIDSRAGTATAERDHAVAAAGTLQGLLPPQATASIPARQAPVDRPVAPARSVDNLMNLVVRGQPSRSHARLQKAIAGLSAGELTGLATGLKARAERDYVPDEWIRHAAVAVVARWMRLDPAPAIEFALRYRPGLAGSMEPAFLDAIGKVFTADRPNAMRLLGMIGNERELYIYARWRCIRSMERISPPEAMVLIADIDARSGNQRYRADFLGEFPDKWIGSDPVPAMEWALALPPGFTRNNILARMGEAWADADPSAAREYLDSLPRLSLPNGSTRNRIMGAITKAEAKAGTKR